MSITFWPFYEQGIALPLFLAVLAPVAVAFLFGWSTAWFRAGSQRDLARQRGARIDKLTAELRQLRARQSAIDETRKRTAEGARLTAASEAARGAAEQELPAHAVPAALASPNGPAAPAIETRSH